MAQCGSCAPGPLPTGWATACSHPSVYCCAQDQCMGQKGLGLGRAAGQNGRMAETVQSKANPLPEAKLCAGRRLAKCCQNPAGQKAKLLPHTLHKTTSSTPHGKLWVVPCCLTSFQLIAEARARPC